MKKFFVQVCLVITLVLAWCVIQAHVGDGPRLPASYNVLEQWYQPTPVYTNAVPFEVPPEAWTSVTSRNWGIQPALDAVAAQLDDEARRLLNDYLSPMQPAGPRHLVFAPNLFNADCVVVDEVLEDGTERQRYDFDPDDAGFVGTNCYGKDDPVFAPCVDVTTGQVDEVCLGSGVSDLKQDQGQDNVFPFGVPDPVNLAFEVLHAHEKPAGMPVSLAVLPEPHNGQAQFAQQIQMVLSDECVRDRCKELCDGDAECESVCLANPGNKIEAACTESVESGRRPVATDPVLLVLSQNRGDNEGTLSILKRDETGFVPTSFPLPASDLPVHLLVNTPVVDNSPGLFRREPRELPPQCERVFDEACQGAQQADCATACACMGYNASPAGQQFTEFCNNFCADNQCADPAKSEGRIVDCIFDEVAALGEGGLHCERPREPVSVAYDVYVLNRGPKDCFAARSAELKVRNPHRNHDGSLLDQNNDGHISSLDTQGMPVSIEGEEAPRVVQAGELGSDRCSFLAIYRLEKRGEDFFLANALQRPDKVPTLPVGYNARMCVFGDFNADGFGASHENPDLLCANTGSPSEGVHGSLTALFRPRKDLSAPNQAPRIGDTLQDEGYVVVDIPLSDSLRSRHPWWITAGILKYHNITGEPGDPGEWNYGEGDRRSRIIIGDEFPPILAAIYPTDFAVTFLDSFELSKGDFGVFLNDIDSLQAERQFYANDLRFSVQDYVTNPLLARGLLTPLTLNNGLYPLGITHGHFLDDFYGEYSNGTDVLERHENYRRLGGRTDYHDGYRIDNRNPLNTCPALLIGLNNSNEVCLWESQFIEPDVSPAVRPVPKRRTCTGLFSPPSETSDCFDASTPVYEGPGNWGPHYVTTGQINQYTERSFPNGESLLSSRDANSDTKHTEDDYTPDLGLINGSPPRLPETLTGLGQAVAFALPQDACADAARAYEVTTILRATEIKDTLDEEELDNLLINRCTQRHGLDNAPALACCLLLESGDYPDAEALVPPIPQDCPGEDPLVCCEEQLRAQNVLAVLLNEDPAAQDAAKFDIDFAQDPPLVNNAQYIGGEAAACDCSELFEELERLGPNNPESTRLYNDLCNCLGAESCGNCENIEDDFERNCCLAGIAGQLPAQCLPFCEQNPDAFACQLQADILCGVDTTQWVDASGKVISPTQELWWGDPVFLQVNTASAVTSTGKSLDTIIDERSDAGQDSPIMISVTNVPGYAQYSFDVSEGEGFQDPEQNAAISTAISGQESPSTRIQFRFMPPASLGKQGTWNIDGVSVQITDQRSNIQTNACPSQSLTLVRKIKGGGGLLSGCTLIRE